MTINPTETLQQLVNASFFVNGFQLGRFLWQALRSHPAKLVAIGALALIAGFALGTVGYTYPFPGHTGFVGRVVCAVQTFLFVVGTMTLSFGILEIQWRKKNRQTA